VEEGVRRGVIDARRVSVGGHSYGEMTPRYNSG
jgi:predicted dienelactone hydrolase